MPTAIPAITLSSSRSASFNRLALSQSYVQRVESSLSIENLDMTSSFAACYNRPYKVHQKAH